VVWCTWVIRCGLVVCFKFVLVGCVALCLFGYTMFVWCCGCCVVLRWLGCCVVIRLLCDVGVTFCVVWWGCLDGLWWLVCCVV